MEGRFSGDPVLFPFSEPDIFVDFPWDCYIKLFAQSAINIDDLPILALPMQRGKLMFILAIPRGFDVADLLRPYMDKVDSISVIRRKTYSSHTRTDGDNDFETSALLSFTNQTSADEFYHHWHLQCFDMTSSQGPVCYLLFVDRLRIGMHTDSDDPPPLSERIPSCPFCIERIDSNVSGLVASRRGWLCANLQGSVCCPACVHLVNPISAVCDSCGEAGSLWLCLICGYRGCGRYSKGCAKSHSVDKAHRLSLEISSGRVWDYRKDCFVHKRLVSIAIDFPENFESLKTLNLVEDAAALNDEMAAQLQLEKEKLENACIQLRVIGESAAGRARQVRDEESRQLEEALSETTRLGNIKKSLQEEMARMKRDISAITEILTRLRSDNNLDMERLKSSKVSVSEKRLQNSRVEVERLREEVSRLALSISS